MGYAFSFDARSCTGCKACQEACKDKNQLPLGVLWRRVVEISGGEWHARGDAWENSVFAYYLSLACNHCTHPKCAGVCPTGAFDVRPDGIVLLDGSKCMGCGYCAWACPYGVPQLDPEHGIMTKCDFCYDNLDAGLPPSCVAACPLRVLNYEPLETLETSPHNLNLWQLPGSEHPYPLPNYSRTEPHLAIQLHPGMTNALPKEVLNREEIIPPAAFENPKGRHGRHELPLVAFTLLIQMAVGIVLYSLVFPIIPLRELLSIGLLFATGGLCAFLHLGRKRNAWRSILHLEKSWLSREILAAGLFGLAWIATFTGRWTGITPGRQWIMAILGTGLIYSMSRVYLLRAVPSWNSWRTLAAFFLSTGLLGATASNLFLPSPGLTFAAAVTMVLAILLAITGSEIKIKPIGWLRPALLGAGTVLILLVMLFNRANTRWPAVIIFLVVLVAESIGRWQFYARREPFPMRSP